MVELRVQRFGDLLGVMLPEDVAALLDARDGGVVRLVEAQEGGLRLVAERPSFEAKKAKAAEIMGRYRNTLRALAKR